MLGANKNPAGQTDDTFIGPAASRRGKQGREFRDVFADDSEIATDQLKDVRAALQRRRLRSIFVWIGSESSQKHVVKPSVRGRQCT